MKANPIKPREFSYWVVPGRFLAGEYPRSLDDEISETVIKELVDFGISHFIDLTTAEDELEPYMHIVNRMSKKNSAQKTVRRTNFQVIDGHIPTIETMNTILDHIDHLLCQGEVIYVHCWGGIGRTGTVVDCWLNRHVNGKISNPPDMNHFYPQQNPPPKNGLELNLLDLWCTNPKSIRKPKPKIPTNHRQRPFVEKWTKQDALVQAKLNKSAFDLTLSTLAQDLESTASSDENLYLSTIEQKLSTVLAQLKVTDQPNTLSAYVFKKLNENPLLLLSGNLTKQGKSELLEISMRKGKNSEILLVRLMQQPILERPHSYLIDAQGTCQIER
jgi:hypothetical protein